MEYVWNNIAEIAAINPTGVLYIDCAPLVDIEVTGGFVDDAPEVLSRKDQVHILQKFEQDGLISIIDFDEGHKGAWFEVVNFDTEDVVNPYSFSRTGTALVGRKEFTTDLERGVLVVNGKKVNVTTKEGGVENNALRLLKTLMKKPGEESYKDEILEDWERKSLNRSDLNRIPRNRVYSAARSLNMKILEQANVSDFILSDTNKFQINPKYIEEMDV